ncbi:MAG: DUF2203 domain-containing protein [Candidatus Binataceae bacterium]
MPHEFDKLFTAEQANELIPRLEVLMRELQIETHRLRSAIGALTSADSSLQDADLAGILELHPELNEIAAKMTDLAAQVESFGCFLKDIDQGLVDFPFEYDGNVALLCWQYGEPHIIAWHSIEGGFGGRQPLPGASKPYLN